MNIRSAPVRMIFAIFTSFLLATIGLVTAANLEFNFILVLAGYFGIQAIIIAATMSLSDLSLTKKPLLESTLVGALRAATVIYLALSASTMTNKVAVAVLGVSLVLLLCLATKDLIVSVKQLYNGFNRENEVRKHEAMLAGMAKYEAANRKQAESQKTYEAMIELDLCDDLRSILK